MPSPLLVAVKVVHLATLPLVPVSVVAKWLRLPRVAGSIRLLREMTEFLSNGRVV